MGNYLSKFCLLEGTVLEIAEGGFATKERWRTFLRDRRRAVPDKATKNAQILRHIANLIQHLGAQTVATYVAVGNEPAAGVPAHIKTLVPVVTGVTPQWAWDTEGLAAKAPFPGRAIPHPSGEILPAEALEECDLVLIPALGIDEDDFRMGQGAGWYDRALLHAKGSVWAVVFDDCFLTQSHFPHERWDLPVDGVITETGVHK